jgi:hypothetical protein
VSGRRTTPTPQGRDGKHYYVPTLEVSPAERKFLSDELDRLQAYTSEANYVKSLPVAWRTEIRETVRWVSSGIRHADGKKVQTRHIRGDLPSEGELLAKAYGYAKGIDSLIERCKAHPAAQRSKPVEQA